MSADNFDQPSPFHPGEVALQRQYGVDRQLARAGQRVIRDHLPEQHRQFFGQLPFIVIGTVDGAGQPWASLLAGEPGFLASPDERTLLLGAKPNSEDPVAAGLAKGEAIGLLGIELQTRRRNRLNGHIRTLDRGGVAVAVEQSFGNCPQYIQVREQEAEAIAAGETPAIELAASDQRIAQLVSVADTFFVTSFADYDGRRHVDTSHRGGRPGFVRVAADGLLTIPDFSGNFYFNTLGNFMLNPHAGLVFPDWETGTLLQMTGDVEVIQASPETSAFEGAQRLWTFRPTRAVLRVGALPFRWRLRSDGWSPRSLATGTWDEADAQVLNADKGGVP